jgi:Ca2+-binding EF-hand superfamily protein
MIDKEEIKDLLIKYNYYVSEKEICALIDRYDRTRDGKISYAEFVEELKPKNCGGR